MTLTTFQKSEQHISIFPVLYPFSEHSGIIQYHATKFEDKKQSLSVLFSTMHSPLKVGFGSLAHAKLVCLRRCMSCQLTRHVTPSQGIHHPPTTYKYQIKANIWTPLMKSHNMWKVIWCQRQEKLYHIFPFLCGIPALSFIVSLSESGDAYIR